MNWLSLSLADWHRRPLRMGLTMMGVAIAIAALWSLLAFQQGYQDGMNGELDRLGAHVLVVPKGCPYDAASIALHGASWPCFLKESYIQQVRAVDGVATAAPVFMNALYDKTGAQIVYNGVQPNLLALKRQWRINGKFPKNRGEVLLGAVMAQKLKAHIGQSLPLPGVQAAAKVSGILAPNGGADDEFIYLPLGDAQKLFGHPGELTHILVRLSDPDKMEDVVAQLRGCDAGLSMNIVPLTHLFHTIQSLVSSTRLLLGCLTLVALLIAGAGVGNAVLMAVVERTPEIGVMRAIGASRGDVFRLFWLETLQICLMGSVLGITVAFVASRSVESWLRARLPFAPDDPLIQWHWWTAAFCLGAALLLGSIVSLLPAWRAASLSPIRAIQRDGGRL